MLPEIKKMGNPTGFNDAKDHIDLRKNVSQPQTNSCHSNSRKAKNFPETIKAFIEGSTYSQAEGKSVSQN